VSLEYIVKKEINKTWESLITSRSVRVTLVVVELSSLFLSKKIWKKKSKWFKGVRVEIPKDELVRNMRNKNKTEINNKIKSLKKIVRVPISITISWASSLLALYFYSILITWRRYNHDPSTVMRQVICKRNEKLICFILWVQVTLPYIEECQCDQCTKIHQYITHTQSKI
jgi:hypothetical protein